MITLIDGRNVDPAQVYFDTVQYHFMLNGEDITNNITRADKLNNFPTFDPGVDNTRLSNERTGGSGPLDDLPTNVTGIFLEQIATDPLAAPAETLSNAAASAKNFVNNNKLSLAVVGIVVLLGVVWIVRK